MQPNQPNVSPGPPQAPTPQTTQPDYSFLGEQPKKSFSLPFVGGSLAGRLFVAVFVLLLLVIILIIIKGLLTTPVFSKPDYFLITERQQEMLHIMSDDVTQSNNSQLSLGEQNFVSTATLALGTAQTATLNILSDYKYKVSARELDNVYSASIDQQFTTAQSANNLGGYFQSEMETQLGLYEKNLKTAYDTTHINSGKNLLRSEYNEAKLLLTSVTSAST